jgi:parallel beta-helix repeat protein
MGQERIHSISALDASIARVLSRVACRHPAQPAASIRRCRATWKSILCGSIILAVLGSGPTWADQCGDTAGPNRTRIACACGDEVVTSTRLRPRDPVVDADCESNGLVIGENDITLDCRGLVISGSPNWAGVVVSVKQNATVRRCQVTGFSSGIDLTRSDGLTIERNNVYRNDNGITVGARLSNSKIFGNRIADNGNEGIVLQISEDNIVKDNEIFGNQGDGIELFGSNRNQLTANLFVENGGNAIVLGSDNLPSNANVIKANFLSRNNGRGDDGQGIADCGNCNENEYLFNIVDRTSEGPGMLIRGSVGVIAGNRGTRNDGSGLLATGQGKTLTGNVFNNNGGDGICAVTGNTDGGGNRGRANQGADVLFDAATCPSALGAFPAASGR